MRIANNRGYDTHLAAITTVTGPPLSGLRALNIYTKESLLDIVHENGRKVRDRSASHEGSGGLRKHFVGTGVRHEVRQRRVEYRQHLGAVRRRQLDLDFGGLSAWLAALSSKASQGGQSDRQVREDRGPACSVGKMSATSSSRSPNSGFAIETFGQSKRQGFRWSSIFAIFSRMEELRGVIAFDSAGVVPFLRIIAPHCMVSI